MTVGASMSFLISAMHMKLVRRLLEREHVLELLLPGRIRRKCPALLRLPFRLDSDERTGKLLQGFPDTGFRLRPFLPAEFVHLRFAAFGTDELLDEIHTGRRDEKGAVVLVFDLEVVAAYALHRQLLHTGVTADAMGLVHDEVTRLQIGEGRKSSDPATPSGPFPCGRAPLRCRSRKQRKA